jgi:hypothetical protein
MTVQCQFPTRQSENLFRLIELLQALPVATLPQPQVSLALSEKPAWLSIRSAYYVCINMNEGGI